MKTKKDIWESLHDIYECKKPIYDGWILVNESWFEDE